MTGKSHESGYSKINSEILVKALRGAAGDNFCQCTKVWTRNTEFFFKNKEYDRSILDRRVGKTGASSRGNTGALSNDQILGLKRK